MNNESEKEMQKLFEEYATPRAEFVDTLKSRVLSEADTHRPHSNLITSFIMKLSPKVFQLGAVAVVATVGIAASTYQFWYKAPTTAEQDAILAKIAQANLSTKKEGTKDATATMLSADEKISALYIRNPEERTYNYKKTKTTYEIGDALNRCSMMVPYQGAVSAEEYSEYYTTKDEMFPLYTKNVSYSGSNIYDYLLIADSTQWLYKGGSYAVQLKNVERVMPLAYMSGVAEKDEAADVAAPPVDGTEQTLIALPEKTPVPTETDPKEIIKNYFGEDAKILGTVTENGKEYYKVQWSYMGGCTTKNEGDESRSVTSMDFNQKIVVVALADTKDFSIDQETIYLDAVKNSNMLYSRNTVEESSTVSSFDAVKSDFTFNLSSDIRTIDASAYKYDEEYRKAVLEYLPKNVSNVVYLSGKYTLQSLSSSYVTLVPEPQKYMIDRAFYSSLAYGQTQYNDAKDMFKPYLEEGKTYPQVQLSYNGTGAFSWLSISELSSQFKGVAAITELGIEKSSLSDKGTTTIALNGESVTAELFEMTQSSVADSAPGSSEPGDSGVAVDEVERLKVAEPTYTDVFVVFTYKDVTVVIQSNLSTKTRLADAVKALPFATVSTSDAAKLDAALKVVYPDSKPEMLMR